MARAQPGAEEQREKDARKGCGGAFHGHQYEQEQAQPGERDRDRQGIDQGEQRAGGKDRQSQQGKADRHDAEPGHQQRQDEDGQGGAEGDGQRGMSEFGEAVRGDQGGPEEKSQRQHEAACEMR